MKHDIRFRFLKTVEDIEDVRNCWIKWQWHLYSDIDYYIQELNIDDCFLEPRVIVFYDVEKPIALIAGRIERRIFYWKVGFLRFGHSEFPCLDIGHHGVLGDFSDVDCKMVNNALKQCLKKDKLNLINFDRFPIDTKMYQLFRKGPGICYRDPISHRFMNYYLVLPDSVEIFLQSKSKSTGKSTKSYKNRLKKYFGDQVQIVHYSDKDDVAKVLSEAKGIAFKTYQHKIGEGVTHAKNLEEKWKYLAERSIFNASVLYIENRPCSFWVCYYYNHGMYGIYTGYDPEYKKYHPGIYLLLHVIQDCFHKKDCNFLDYGLGSEIYKKNYSNNMRYVENFVLFNTSLKGWWYKFLRFITVGFAQIMGILLKKIRIYNYVKRLWRKKVVT